MCGPFYLESHNMKWTVYYCISGSSSNRVSRDYPDYPIHADVKAEWKASQVRGTKRIYLQHEPHVNYVTAFAPMVGKDEDDQRDWLMDRVDFLDAQDLAEQQKKLAGNISGNPDVYGGMAPGTIVRDQNGRSGRVPNVPLEVFRRKDISADAAMDAVRDFCKGGGTDIPRGS